MHKFYADGRAVNANEIGVPSMNYGQIRNHLNEGYRMALYEIHIEKEQFLKILKPLYEELIDDEKNDEKNYIKGEFEISDLLRSKNFPSIEEELDLFTDDNNQFITEVCQFLEISLLDRICAGEKLGDGFIIHSLDEIYRNEDCIKIIGKCLTKRPFTNKELHKD